MAATRRLHEVAATLWREYERWGPGRRELSPALLEAVEAAWQDFQSERQDWPIVVQQAAERIVDLSRRCVLHPQGLSFVTGEAGLVPRPDLHRAFEESLRALAASDGSR